MPKCAVKRCLNSSRNLQKKDGVSYFSFPRNPVRCLEWTAIIAKSRDEINYKPFKGSVVCSDHFPASEIYTTTKGFNRLSRSAKPILNINSSNPTETFTFIEGITNVDDSRASNYESDDSSIDEIGSTNISSSRTAVENREATERDEDLKNFGKYVTSSLRLLSPEDSIYAQDEIQRVLTKYKLKNIQSQDLDIKTEVLSEQSSDE